MFYSTGPWTSKLECLFLTGHPGQFYYLWVRRLMVVARIVDESTSDSKVEGSNQGKIVKNLYLWVNLGYYFGFGHSEVLHSGRLRPYTQI
jgi:hypothetical protein